MNESLTYDKDGNLKSDGRWTYTWNAENRLVGLQTNATPLATGHRRLTFAYDSVGRRFEKKVETYSETTWQTDYHRHFIYDAWNLLAELDAINNNSPVNTFTWGTDLSATMQGAGGIGGLLSSTHHGVSTSQRSPHLPAYDHNGNITAYVHAPTGVVVANGDYDAFGNEVDQLEISPEQAPFRFSTKFSDSVTGLSYYGYRYYDSRRGRWLNRDPLFDVVGQYAELLQEGGNIVAIVANKLLNITDPLGLEAFSFVDDNAKEAHERLNKTKIGSRLIKIVDQMATKQNLTVKVGTQIRDKETGKPNSPPCCTRFLVIVLPDQHYIDKNPYWAPRYKPTQGVREGAFVKWEIEEAYIHELMHARDRLSVGGHDFLRFMTEYENCPATKIGMPNLAEERAVGIGDKLREEKGKALRVIYTGGPKYHSGYKVYNGYDGN